MRHDHEAVLRARDGAAHEQQIALGVGADDFEVLMGGAVDAVVARPAAALERVAGVRVAVRGGLTMDHRAVARAAAAEVVALDAAGEAVALRDRLHVDAVAFGEAVDGDASRRRRRRRSRVRNSRNDALRLEPGLLDNARQGRA